MAHSTADTLPTDQSQALVYKSTIDRCRFCLVEKSRKPLVDACGCTKLRFTHLDCLEVFVTDTEQFHCELCRQPFRVSAKVHKEVDRAVADRYLPGTPEPAKPSKEEIYFMWSSLLDRIIVAILLYIYLAYLSPSLTGPLPYYLVGYALVYLTFKFFCGGLRVRQLYCHIKNNQRPSGGNIVQ